MKKVLFLIIFLSCWSSSSGQTDLNLSEKEKNKAWEFILRNYFPNGVNHYRHVEKFYDDIYYFIVNGTQKDSLALQETIKEITPIIPYKISYTENREQANFIIELSEPKDSLSANLDQEAKTQNKDGYYKNQIVRQNYLIELPEKYHIHTLKNIAVVGLTEAFPRKDVKILEDNKLHNHGLFNRSFAVSKDNSSISDWDKFIIKNFYAPDLNQNLENYVKSQYGLWFWLNLNFDEELLKATKLTFLIFLLTFGISATYSLTSKIKFKYSILNYLLNGILFSNIALSIFFLNDYFKVYKANELFTTAQPSFPDLTIISKGYIVMSIIVIPFVVAVFTLDHYTIYKSKSLTRRFFKRISNFIIVSIIACLLFLLRTNNYSPNTLFFLTLIFSVLVAFGLIRSILLYFKERNHDLLRQKDVQLSQLTASKAQAEVASLHARINPHFLYNSLNSIAGLAHVNADKTEKMALSLSNLFRHNLNRKDEAYSSIQEEIEAVEAYLEIEQIRFGDRLQFSIEVDETLNELQIPRNIIQPLIENAVKHGVSALEGQGILKLEIIQNPDTVEISVYDNGPAFPEGIVSGYGLQSVFDILELSFEGKAALQWESEPKKRIWISIEKNELKKVQDAI